MAVVGSMVEWLGRWDVIDMILVQHLLAPFCCVLEKDTKRYFPLLSGLGKQF